MKSSHESYPTVSIQVEQWLNQECEEPLLGEIERSLVELRKILPDFPSQVSVLFDSRDFIDSVGVTGYAKSKDSIGVCVNPNSKDKNKLIAEIKPFIFHEGYHMLDGFHYNAGKFSGIDAAIAEGKAVVFETQYTTSTPSYANWQDEQDKLNGWYEQLKNISADEYFESSGETWRRWALWDDNTKEAWRVYKLGTWMIESLIAAEGKDVKDLCGVSAVDILQQFEELARV